MGRTVSDFAFYNSAWDAATVQVDRRSSECFVINDARLTERVAVGSAGYFSELY